MSTTSPPMSADETRARMQGIDWWHQIDLGHGIVTPGRGGDTAMRLERLYMPIDLSGRSVLDLGAWDGAFSFAAEGRGADRIVAVNERPKPGLELAREALASRVESVQADLMELTVEQVGGPFDVVLFLGVLYHLPDPVAGLRRVHEFVAPGGLMIMETDTALNWLPTAAAALVGNPEGYDEYSRNWWRPNWRASVSLCRQVGFADVRVLPLPEAEGPAVRRAIRHAAQRLLPARHTIHGRRPARS